MFSERRLGVVQGHLLLGDQPLHAVQAVLEVAYDRVVTIDHILNFSIGGFSLVHFRDNGCKTFC